jgi:hypothetical protein
MPTSPRVYTPAEYQAALLLIVTAGHDETMAPADRLAVIDELAWSVLSGTFEAPALDVAMENEEEGE